MLRFKEFLESSRSEAESYFDIGHGVDEIGHKNDYLWLYDEYADKLSTVRYRKNMYTHGMSWGRDKVDNSWRGRFDYYQQLVSIVPPYNNWSDKQKIPGKILTSLTKRFKKAKFKYFDGARP